MNPLVGRTVLRMNGAGNKILVLDQRGAPLPTPDDARALHRAPGLDYDQLMVLADPRDARTLAFVQIYNNDGRLAGACGNGTRCVADHLARATGRESFLVQTQAGLIACEQLGETIYRIDMGAPRRGWRDIPLSEEVGDVDAVALELGLASVVNMGNPHVVFFVADVDALSVETLGPHYETHPLFPEKANVSFAEVLSSEHIRLRVWERGVGITLACGSAACATLVAAASRGLTGRRADVDLPGGRLGVEWREGDGHVLMSGPVEFERAIILSAEMLAR